MSRLTEPNRKTLAKARQLADLKGMYTIREYTGEEKTELALGAALGTAQELLWQMAAIIDRLDGADG
jgi:hypothetical protein